MRAHTQSHWEAVQRAYKQLEQLLLERPNADIHIAAAVAVLATLANMMHENYAPKKKKRKPKEV